MSGLSARHSPVLVTGASGFVGACLVRRLLEEGFEVHVLLRAEARCWRLVDIMPRLHAHCANVLDAVEVADVLHTVRPQTVYHLATFGAYESQADARRILETNILGTYNLLEASVAAGVRLFVSTGSSSEYGFKSEPMAESDRLEPNSFYAVAKAAQTHLCSLLAQRREMAVVALRLFSVFGPWEEPSRLFPTLLRRALADQPLEMTSPDTARDFVYVDDIVDALLALERLELLSGEVLNLGSGKQTTLGELVDTVRTVLGSRSEVRWGAMPARHWDAHCWVANMDKTAERLGWRPRVALPEAIGRMARWIKAQGELNATPATH
jgi:nucleoside-diphosphate-sugar epimerase